MRIRELLNITKRKGQAGYTLIEVMVALIVVSTGLVAYTTLHVRSITSNANSFAITDTSNSVSDFIERVVSQDYDSVYGVMADGEVTVDPASDTIDNDGDGSIDETDDGDDGSRLFQITWTVEPNNVGSETDPPLNSTRLVFTITRVTPDNTGSSYNLTYLTAQLR